MSLQTIKDTLPTYAKDIKLNLTAIFNEEQAGGLSKQQIVGIALACAYATKQSLLIAAIADHGGDVLDEKSITACKAAATIMAMNNIYYRFLHLVNDDAYQHLPAKLRMNIMADPGINKFDFELYALAVSAINGCGMCIESHVRALEKAGFLKEAIQTAIRIAAVVHAVAFVITVEKK